MNKLGIIALDEMITKIGVRFLQEHGYDSNKELMPQYMARREELHEEIQKGDGEAIVSLVLVDRDTQKVKARSKGVKIHDIESAK